MQLYKTGILVGIILLSLMGCSRKKNKFLNRNFHAMTTYYNILYHGGIEIQKGIDAVKEAHVDHYFDILPIERMAVVPPDRNDTVPLNEFFGNAELKATKGIQKHSMFMGGKEYNFQVDEAYLLLGIARYYDQRYIPAKDAFSFIINHYPDSKIITKAEIWLQKTNMRLNYEETALQNLQKIQAENANILPEDLVEIYTSLAHLYIKEENYQAAIEPIGLAAEYVETYDEKARWLYIKAQLYNQVGNKDSANANFQKVIELKRKPPRDYMVHSIMEIFKNDDYQAEDTPFVKEYFLGLHEDWENRNFLDYLYFEAAQHYLKIDSIDVAIDYYNKSLRKDPKNAYLKSRDYINLADIYFDRASYKTAGFYYDSTMTNIDQNTREYRLLKKKRENLDDVIKYEDIAAKNDSILKLVDYTEEERLAFFTKYTETLKEEAKSLFAQQKKDDRLANVAAPQIGGFGSTSAPTMNSAGKEGDKFYFYNEASISSGKSKFRKTWGDIELADNWRLEAKKKGSTNTEEVTETKSEEEELFADPRFDPKTYLSEIPSEPQVIDSISDERNYAYFQLGVIYKEKFKENELAIDRFTRLLDFKNVDESLVLPTKYNLYLAYLNLQDIANADYWKQHIITEHPNSKYAQLLLNPRSIRDGENSPNQVYTRLYKRFQKQDVEGLLEEIDYWEAEFTGMPIIPKFKLLKAQVKGRMFGYEVYKEELEQVALDHPQTKEGKKAKELFDNLKGGSNKAKFIADEGQESFKLVFYFDASEYAVEQLNELANQLKEGLTELNYEQVQLSTTAYNQDYNFLVLQDFATKLGTQGMADLLLEKEIISQDWEYFPISKENYSILQIYKNMEEYLQIQ